MNRQETNLGIYFYVPMHSTPFQHIWVIKSKMLFWLFWQGFDIRMSCSQIELPNSALKCLKTGPKPRQLEVWCAKSLDFTMKNRYFVGHFSIWYPRVPLMRLVPKVAFFQVLLEGLESKLPQTAAEAGYRKMWFSTDFFKSTSLDHHSLMFSNFPRSSLLYSCYDDRGK